MIFTKGFRPLGDAQEDKAINSKETKEILRTLSNYAVNQGNHSLKNAKYIEKVV